MAAPKRKYQVLEPDVFYNLPLVPEDTTEEKIESIAGRCFGGYRIKTTITGSCGHVAVFPWYGRSKDLPEKKKRERLPEEISAANERRSQQLGQDLLNNNFTNNDIWFTGTWADNNLPTTYGEQNAYKKNFVERLRRRHINNGGKSSDFKWFAALEADYDKKIRPNAHFVICGDLSLDEVESLWRGSGRNETRHIVTDKNGITGMAIYITKPEGKNRRRRWTCSKNLKRPEIKIADNKTTKSQVHSVAKNAQDVQAYFEKLYTGWEITQVSTPKYNEKNGGVFLYARICIRDYEKAIYRKDILKNELLNTRLLSSNKKAKKAKSAKPPSISRFKRKATT